MEVDLEALLLLDPRQPALERFIARCLADGGIWNSPRSSDGIDAIDRVLERGPDRLRVRGRIWRIEQTVHSFWLELGRDASDHVTWFLYFDIASSRSARSALDAADRPEDVEWRARLAGEATVQDGALTLVPGSTRVVVHDLPEPEPPRERRRRRQPRD